MPRIVVTSISGELVRNLWVPNAELVRRVVEMIETMPDLPLYIDGDELPPEQRASLLYQAAEVRDGASRLTQDLAPADVASRLTQDLAPADAASRLTQDLAPADAKEVLGVLAMSMEEMRRDCSELRRIHIHSTREFGLLVQAQNRMVLEEGIRARSLLHQSLDDIDAIDRAVTVAKLKRSLEPPPPAAGGRALIMDTSNEGLMNHANNLWQGRHEGRKK